MKSLGYWGHGLSAALESGGVGRISKVVMLLAPCTHQYCTPVHLYCTDLSQRGSDAVAPGVTSTDDNHIETLGGEGEVVNGVAVLLLLPGLQELHGKVDT